MELKPGARLGPYEILSCIGAGGMGQVWKARDTRLDRPVAIKTSHEKFSERFEREARAVAAINHPNICTLYDVGPDYLVMEYVEGTEVKGPLPLDHALQLAIQMASAIEAAHRKLITHRDLKPANVLVTKAGIKVLDFGLAKFEQTKEAKANDETLTLALTQEGSIVGTLQYMAPEQLQGKVTDGRADIFSFGCVLYEMLTGKRAFDGTSTASVIAAILERPAPSVSGVAPAALDRVVRKCLEKDREDRWQTARDLKDELTWIASGGAQVNKSPAASRGLLPWRAAGLFAVSTAALAVWTLKPAPVRPTSRTVIALAPDERFANLNNPVVAISPDGVNVVYVASRGTGPAQLFLRPVNALKAEAVAGTDNAASPFFSPDSQSVAFFADGKLKKVSVAGGAVATLCDAGAPTPGGAWSSNNTILFQSQPGALSEVPADGGTPRHVTAKASHVYNRWPEFTQDGQAFVFAGGVTSGFFAEEASLWVAAVGGGEADKDLVAGTAPRLTAAGDLIYARNGTLMAVPFNSRRLELAGTPVPVLEGVRESKPGAAQYGLSASGTLVYVAGGMLGSAVRMVWVDRAGKEQLLAAPPHVYAYPRLSPDGRRIGVQISEAASDVWFYDLAGDTLSRATFGGKRNTVPLWSSDGKRLAFESNRDGVVANLFWQPADDSGTAERLRTSPFQDVPQSWSPDGQTILFTEATSETGTDIWTLGLTDRKAQPFLNTPSNEAAPRFSPDGHWIAYVSDESGRIEVYVQPYPGPGGKWQVSTEGGVEPVWSPTGRELFYRSGNRMMAVSVTLQPGFSAGKPVALFEGPWLPSASSVADYDVSRDGRHFLMLRPADEDQDARQIVVVQNWFEELKKLKK